MHQVLYYVQTKPHKSLTFMLNLYVYLKICNNILRQQNSCFLLSGCQPAGIKATMEGPAVAAERKRKSRRRRCRLSHNHGSRGQDTVKSPGLRLWPISRRTGSFTTPDAPIFGRAAPLCTHVWPSSSLHRSMDFLWVFRSVRFGLLCFLNVSPRIFCSHLVLQYISLFNFN